MSELYDYKEYKNKILSENKDIKKQYENLDFKYKLIDMLIEFRNKNNLTQKELAKKIGVKQQIISRFETGKVNPRIDFVQKIVKAMDKKIELV